MAHARPVTQPLTRLVATLLVAIGMAGVAGPAEAMASPPTAPTETAVGWRQVTTGRSHTCAVRTDGRLYCWGWDLYGQLGDGGAASFQTSPVQVAGRRTDWASVSAGQVHTCALRTDGRLFCWGRDIHGQLGDDEAYADQPTPVQVAGRRTDWAAVTAGGYHTCARTTDRRLHCWGDGDRGQLGDGGTDPNRPTPVEVAGGRTDWATVGLGGQHSCARTTDGRLFCWGDDRTGALGDDEAFDDRPTPVEVAGGRTDWTTVTAGGNHTCARRTDRRLFCWGANFYGEVGDGSIETLRPTPVEVAGGRTDWAAVSAGNEHTCARRTDRRLFCWGSNFSGKLGHLGADANEPRPVQVAGRHTDWATPSAGVTHTCATRSGARLFCWGRDAYGQVGDGSRDRVEPTPVRVRDP